LAWRTGLEPSGLRRDRTRTSVDFLDDLRILGIQCHTSCHKFSPVVIACFRDQNSAERPAFVVAHSAATNKTATHGVIHRPPFLFAGQISPLAAAQTHPRRTSSRGMRRAWCQCLSGSGGAVDQLCAEDALFCVDRLLGNARRHSGRALPRQLLVVRTISVVAEGAAAATSALTRWLPRKPLAPSSNALSSAMLVEVQFRHSG
jgi:hypothetical protein